MISKTECEKELWHAEHDTDQRFEERLLAGEITYFDPYLDMHRPTSGKFGSRAYTVAQHGFAMDEIIRMRKTSRYMMAEVLMEELIKYGHVKEHYEDWAVHESKNIQRELAKNGYCLDTLLRVGEAEELGGKLTKTDFHGLAKLHDDWDVVNYIGARKETTNGNNQSNRNDPIW